MQCLRSIGLSLAFASSLLLASPDAAHGQDDAHRGRKYKAPAPTSHIEVIVRKKFNGKPVMNAAVVFDSTKDGKDEGSLEVKTDPEGKAVIDIIPTGSTVRVQVIATGFATFAQEYVVTEPSREIEIALLHPQAQVSDYVDNDGKPTQRKPGVQEPIRPTTPAPAAKPQTSTPPPAPQQPPTAPDATPKQ